MCRIVKHKGTYSPPSGRHPPEHNKPSGSSGVEAALEALALMIPSESLAEEMWLVSLSQAEEKRGRWRGGGWGREGKGGREDAHLQEDEPEITQDDRQRPEPVVWGVEKVLANDLVYAFEGGWSASRLRLQWRKGVCVRRRSEPKSETISCQTRGYSERRSQFMRLCLKLTEATKHKAHAVTKV